MTLITGRVREDDPLPDYMAKLPIDEAGRPTPFFASLDKNGKHDFRVVTTEKMNLALRAGLCWVCGRPLLSRKSFLVGPMCTVSRTASDPPSHYECASWSARNCPFMANPLRVRREANLPIPKHEFATGGIMVERNPGVCAVWTTKEYSTFPDGRGGRLIHMGDPVQVDWWSQGRPATHEEVMTSMGSGLPALYDTCRGNARAVKELEKAIEAAKEYLPA